VSGGNAVRGEIRQFLTTRRAKITPELAGLPNYGRRRRVAGLRREEVALLAGISIEYYTRLERGDARGVSEEVLDALAGGLQLDDVERAHLNDLIRTADASRPVRRRPGYPRTLVMPRVSGLRGARCTAPHLVCYPCAGTGTRASVFFGEEPSVTTSNATGGMATGQRRLRVIEIAVLADDHELEQVCDRVCAALNVESRPVLPLSVSCYDGADLPRSIQAELMDDIDFDRDLAEDFAAADATDAGGAGPVRRRACA
jgi:hypothetical protein